MNKWFTGGTHLFSILFICSFFRALLLIAFYSKLCFFFVFFNSLALPLSFRFHVSFSLAASQSSFSPPFFFFSLARFFARSLKGLTPVERCFYDSQCQMRVSDKCETTDTKKKLHYRLPCPMKSVWYEQDVRFAFFVPHRHPATSRISTTAPSQTLTNRGPALHGFAIVMVARVVGVVGVGNQT